MSSERFEMRFPTELLQRVDRARGHEPRASFVKRMVEAALSGDVAVRGEGTQPMQTERPAAPPRASATSPPVNHAMERQKKLNDAKYGRRS